MKAGDFVVLASKRSTSSFGQPAFVLVPFFEGEIAQVTTDGLSFVGGVFAPFAGFDVCLPGKKREKE